MSPQRLCLRTNDLSTDNILNGLACPVTVSKPRKDTEIKRNGRIKTTLFTKMMPLIQRYAHETARFHGHIPLMTEHRQHRHATASGTYNMCAVNRSGL